MWPEKAFFIYIILFTLLLHRFSFVFISVSIVSVYQHRVIQKVWQKKEFLWHIVVSEIDSPKKRHTQKTKEMFQLWSDCDWLPIANRWLSQWMLPSSSFIVFLSIYLLLIHINIFVDCRKKREAFKKDRNERWEEKTFILNWYMKSKLLNLNRN